MKKILVGFILFSIYFIFHMGTAYADSNIGDIQKDLRKCKFSARLSLITDIVECLKKAKRRSVSFKERVQAGVALLKCTKGDITSIPECIDKLSEYILQLEDAKYRELVTCTPVREITTFDKLAELDDKTIVAVCERYFGDSPDEIVNELTKHDIIRLFFDESMMVLIDNDLLFYSVKELEIYFEYMKALYEAE